MQLSFSIGKYVVAFSVRDCSALAIREAVLSLSEKDAHIVAEAIERSEVWKNSTRVSGKIEIIKAIREITRPVGIISLVEGKNWADKYGYLLLYHES